eukprot:RCo008879
MLPCSSPLSERSVRPPLCLIQGVWRSKNRADMSWKNLVLPAANTASFNSARHTEYPWHCGLCGFEWVYRYTFDRSADSAGYTQRRSGQTPRFCPICQSANWKRGRSPGPTTNRINKSGKPMGTATAELK